MKYANLILDQNKEMENVGDWVQIFAVENLYKYMGVEYSQVVRIKISELNTYDGETVILPINFPLYGYYDLSPKIIPVYLGISVIDRSVAKGLRMHAFQPIGCRDYHTFSELREEGLNVYYGGCLTVTFSKRKNKPIDGKVFIVGISPDVANRIPNEVKKDAIYAEHIFYGTECRGETNAKKVFERYNNEASLVITSKIHCAQPCLAAGIPVIFICEKMSFRYDVLKQYIPVYSIDDMKQVDWNPKEIDIELHKKTMLSHAAERVINTYNTYERSSRLSDFFMGGEMPEYLVDTVWAIKSYIELRWQPNDTFEYILWGITQIAEATYKWITKKYPYAILKEVIDIAKDKEFHGIKAVGLETLANCDCPVFVTVGSANSMAEEVFEKYKVTRYVICYNNKYIVDGEVLVY